MRNGKSEELEEELLLINDHITYFFFTCILFISFLSYLFYFHPGVFHSFFGYGHVLLLLLSSIYYS